MPSPEFNYVPEDRTTIVCLYCEKTLEVGRKALSVVCKYCHKSLKLEDIKYKDYQARRFVETCGVVTVEKKGNVVTDRITCGGLIVRGKCKGDILSRGPVLVGPEAEVKGNVIAPTIAIGAGAILDGNYQIGMHKAEAPPPATAGEGEQPPATS